MSDNDEPLSASHSKILIGLVSSLVLFTFAPTGTCLGNWRFVSHIFTVPVRSPVHFPAYWLPLLPRWTVLLDLRGGGGSSFWKVLLVWY